MGVALSATLDVLRVAGFQGDATKSRTYSTVDVIHIYSKLMLAHGLVETSTVNNLVDRLEFITEELLTPRF